MPKLEPFALANTTPRPSRPQYLLVFYLVFAIPLFASHLNLLTLPYFWDELGQFIPTALDLLRHGALVTTSAVPNVHPPGVEAYLVPWFGAFGASILTARLAMLTMASAGLLVLFLLAIRLSRGTKGAPAFLPPVLLLISPLFYTQSMMAQLDMPAMVFTLLSLLLFLGERYVWAAVATIALVLSKETGLVVPACFFIFLWRQGRRRDATYFLAPAVLLATWLVILHGATGYWLGDPGFAHYNVEYSLHPMRVVLTTLRRLYYLFVGEFRLVGTVLIVLALRKAGVFRGRDWSVVLAVCASTIVLVSILGGAELERYLLPVLPIFYIAVAIALTLQPRWVNWTATAVLLAGLVFSNFWNPPYPFPYENNLAMIDFVRLQQGAASVLEQSFPNERVATAWPYTAALRHPDFGYVNKPLRTVETGDFQYESLVKLAPSSFNVLVVYTRTWSPERSIIAFQPIRQFLTRFYGWQPEVTTAQCAKLGLSEAVSWEARGQRITIYVRR